MGILPLHTSGSSYKIIFSCRRFYGLGYNIVIFIVSAVLGVVFAATFMPSFLFESFGVMRRRMISCWIYAVFLVEYMSTTSPETEVVSWYGLKGGEHCLRYATREYTAKLTGASSLDITDQGEMMKLCRETPTVIHGQTLFTDFCQDLGFGRGVWGFWIVDFEESDCETKWGDFVDLGCTYLNVTETGSQEQHFRRVESQLENLQEGSSWQIMCATTPAYINGHHFGGPDRCHSSPVLGTYGMWDLCDGSCGIDHSDTRSTNI